MTVCLSTAFSAAPLQSETIDQLDPRCTGSSWKIKEGTKGDLYELFAVLRSDLFKHERTHVVSELIHGFIIATHHFRLDFSDAYWPFDNVRVTRCDVICDGVQE